MTLYYCTAAQLAHEIFRAGAAGAVAVTLTRDAASPYRARGSSRYIITVALSWHPSPLTLTLIDTRGRVRSLQYLDAVALVGGCVSGAVSLSITMHDAGSISPPSTAARGALLAARWHTSTSHVNPAASAAIRAAWEGRTGSARRSANMADAEAIDGAVAFDTLRGVA